MHTLGDIAKALNRLPLSLSGLQRRFQLPDFEGIRAARWGTPLAKHTAHSHPQPKG